MTIEARGRHVKGLAEEVATPVRDKHPDEKTAAIPALAEKSNCHRILCGPMIPLVTHYNRDMSLDLGAYKEYIDFLVAQGIQTGQGCLLVGGAGGDFPMLSVSERATLAHTAAEAAGRKVPIVFSAQATDLRDSLELVRVADDVGAFASQVSPPFYFRPSGDDVVRWIRQIDSSSKKAGIMVYNTYWEGYHMPYPVLDEMVSFDRVVSVKWSTPNPGRDYLRGVSRYSAKVAIIDNCLTWPITAMAGGTGFITHLASTMPRHHIELFNLTRSGKYKEALESMQAVDWPWADFRFEMESRTCGEAPPVKAAMELCGRPGGPSRPPSRALNAEERETLRKLLLRIGAPVI